MSKDVNHSSLHLLLFPELKEFEEERQGDWFRVGVSSVPRGLLLELFLSDFNWDQGLWNEFPSRSMTAAKTGHIRDPDTIGPGSVRQHTWHYTSGTEVGVSGRRQPLC
jgi:hypothetical protein